MMQVWKVYNGFVYKLWRISDAGWCVRVRSRHRPPVAGLTAESASEFDTAAEAEAWALAWIDQASPRLAEVA